MHPTIFAAFDRICKDYNAGGDVLEVGAVPQPDTLLCLPSLANARSRIGINLLESCSYRGFEIRRIDANDMRAFDAASFDTILCNATLEHDRFFWRTLAEIKRVARSGALIMIGVPGYDAKVGGWLSWMTAGLSRFAPASWWFGTMLEALQASTPTLVVHNFPSDYYRFSSQALHEVFLEGLNNTEVTTVLKPPRFIGLGFKP